MQKSSEAFAHTLDHRPPSDWQPLREHLEQVAELAEAHAHPFGAGPWGRLAGLWHDLGKYRPEFQAYLRGERPSAEHAVHGALLAQEEEKRLGKRGALLPLAFVIAGHHTGLANLVAGGEGLPRTPLASRLKEKRPLLDPLIPHLPEKLRRVDLPTLPDRLLPRRKLRRTEKEDLHRTLELWTRFLFSALVDADFLDTERFLRGDERRRLTVGFDDLPNLRRRLDRHVDELAAGAPPTGVNRVRAEVLAACRRKAEEPPGLFSLSVPTGGGKTLASMSFALRHAEEHALRRVIAVIPYTSIIEQNAAVYRRALGARNVIEHHSNLDPAKENRRNKLASENWDAPVIVTTAVQFFESCFANRSSRCRKLHNVARSTILLDEAQTLPPELLSPILELLRELRDHYGCTVLLSTATQPALQKRDDEGRGLDDGLEGVREIVDDPENLARRLRRFDVEWPDPESEPVSWPALAAELRDHERVLAVVHRRRDARELARLLPEEGLFHLSALMCAAHRAKVLAEVLAALKETGKRCRLVSTQLIEAGVDVDFPVVYRALGGLDSVIQAGGRCNREGAPDPGRLVVFRAPTPPPPGTPKMGLESTTSLLKHGGGHVDVEDPKQVTAYFDTLYAKKDRDQRGIQPERAQLNFATVAHRFRLIEDYHRPVLVPYGEAAKRLERFRAHPDRDTLRALQPYLVNVSQREIEQLRNDAALDEVHDTVLALMPGYQHLYHPRYGLVLDEEVRANPEALMA
jgi:CRISPR-associated endonuclease/helicase Cas3